MQIRNRLKGFAKRFLGIFKFIFSFFTMEYYSDEHHHMYSHRYIKYDEFKSLVDMLKNVKFHQKSSRDEVLEFLSTIVTFEINRIDIAPKYPFFDMDDNYISKLLSLVRSSLDLPDRHFEKSVQLVSENFGSLNDSKTAFMNHVHKLSKLFSIDPKNGLIYGLYLKRTFEKRYGLCVHRTQRDNGTGTQ